MPIRHILTKFRAASLSSVLPPCVFIVAILAMVLLFHDFGYTALPPTPQRYSQVKEEFNRLAKDTRKNQYRDQWEQIAKEFIAIYEADPRWPNRPAALFRAAETYEELAKHSFSNQDAKQAVLLYEKVAKVHPRSQLADDALYRSAKVYAAWLRDDQKALEKLQEIKKRYPDGDMYSDALALEKTLRAADSGQLSPEAKTVIRSEKKAIDDTAGPDSAASQERISRQYEACKTRMKDLLSDSNRSCWRQPWENLENEFLEIHKKSKTKSIAAGALFRAAQTRHNLAKCSLQKKDYKRATEIYQSLPTLYPKSALADDAMFIAAQILRDRLNDTRQSKHMLSELIRRYPTGDKIHEARRELSRAVGIATPPHLEVLSWDSLDKNRVKITLELTGKTEYTARLVDGKQGNSKRLYLDLNDATISANIRKGVVIKGSLLQGIYVEKDQKHPSIIRFDLREARRFDVSRSGDKKTLTVLVDARKSVQPMNEKRGENIASSGAPERSASRQVSAPAKNVPVKASAVNDMARQLGLSIHTIFIDAGHGGKDPGTYHNNVVERLVTLDVARTLGRLLENNGFEVVYSRKTDTFISLSQRTRAANAARADLFISIHVNASENTSANGFETYYLDMSRSANAARVAALENTGSDRRLGDLQQVIAEIMLTARTDESARLAIDIQRVTLSRLKRGGITVRNNGVKSAPFHVLIGAQMPAILVELGYCSNAEEAKRLTMPQYRELLAQGLAEGIMAYRDRIMNRRSVENSLTPTVSSAM